MTLAELRAEIARAREMSIAFDREPAARPYIVLVVTRRCAPTGRVRVLPGVLGELLNAIPERDGWRVVVRVSCDDVDRYLDRCGA